MLRLYWRHFVVEIFFPLHDSLGNFVKQLGVRYLSCCLRPHCIFECLWFESIQVDGLKYMISHIFKQFWKINASSSICLSLHTPRAEQTASQSEPRERASLLPRLYVSRGFTDY
jgi:hypothetical protein